MMDRYPSTIDVPSEDVLLGSPEGRHLSPVRRFFCLLVTFDLLFTGLLYILCVILVSFTENFKMKMIWRTTLVRLGMLLCFV